RVHTGIQDADRWEVRVWDDDSLRQLIYPLMLGRKPTEVEKGGDVASRLTDFGYQPWNSFQERHKVIGVRPDVGDARLREVLPLVMNHEFRRCGLLANRGS